MFIIRAPFKTNNKLIMYFINIMLFNRSIKENKPSLFEIIFRCLSILLY